MFRNATSNSWEPRSHSQTFYFHPVPLNAAPMGRSASRHYSLVEPAREPQGSLRPTSLHRQITEEVAGWRGGSGPGQNCVLLTIIRLHSQSLTHPSTPLPKGHETAGQAKRRGGAPTRILGSLGKPRGISFAHLDSYPNVSSLEEWGREGPRSQPGFFSQNPLISSFRSEAYLQTTVTRGGRKKGKKIASYKLRG